MVSGAEPSEQGYFSEEFKLYLSRPLLPRKSNPFTFWAQSENAMPGLSAVAFKYLTVIGSSVASERLVSTLNDVLSDKRCRLTDQHITERVFMNRLEEQYWPSK
ncbi:hypothetical protein JTE90_022837 [Oedothorax gibbosus]|uniref:HAT C-terminal dimerisation domain-containing protein n=1 Tax=Oedothorax gibbosus TaxID=931172 RepID=A0AAV6TMA9_9ARAC|nr:hypothetical protein JTE90_022837 [Oedothorax gibbosus]